jgi:hypothetical protein
MSAVGAGAVRELNVTPVRGHETVSREALSDYVSAMGTAAFPSASWCQRWMLNDAVYAVYGARDHMRLSCIAHVLCRNPFSIV